MRGSAVRPIVIAAGGTGGHFFPAEALAAELVARRNVGGKCLLDVVLHNPTRSVALMTHLQLHDANTRRRILPVFYGDNYVSLLPGEHKTVTVEASLPARAAPIVLIDGWNVTVVPAPGLAPNAAALALGSPVAPTRPDTAHPLRISCGGSGDRGGFFTFGAAPAPANGFVADTDYTGGATKTVGDAIDVHAPNAAPPAVYQSERWGVCTYTLPVTPGKTYLVRLHFAETTYDAAGKRRFHVDINGQRVLTDLDVFAEAGGKDKAVVKDFPGVRPDAGGSVVVAFTKGSADLPKISGIEVIGE